MKKIYLFLLVAVAFSCSGDDSVSGSVLKFGATTFEPTQDPSDITLIHTTSSDIDFYTFDISAQDDTDSNFHRISFSVSRDDGKPVSGTYKLSNNAGGAYYENNKQYDFGINGSITIKHLGNERYKIVFNNAKCYLETDYSQTVIGKGTFTGQFQRFDF